MPLLLPLGLYACLLVGWEAYCRLAAIPPQILPPPSGVGLALWSGRTEIAAHALATLQVTLIGFGISTIFALTLSVLFHASARLERMVLPLLTITQTIPMVALAPLMILWFGFGLLPKVLLVVLVTFLPMLISLLGGYRRTPQDFRDLVRAMGAGPWDIYRRVTLPHALPSFFAGLRISATYGIVACIFAEYAGPRQGLGIFILTAKNAFRADLVLAAVVVSAALTLTLLGMVRLAEKALSHA